MILHFCAKNLLPTYSPKSIKFPIVLTTIPELDAQEGGELHGGDGQRPVPLFHHFAHPLQHRGTLGAAGVGARLGVGEEIRGLVGQLIFEGIPANRSALLGAEEEVQLITVHQTARVEDQLGVAGAGAGKCLDLKG